MEIRDGIMPTKWTSWKIGEGWTKMHFTSVQQLDNVTAQGFTKTTCNKYCTPHSGIQKSMGLFYYHNLYDNDKCVEIENLNYKNL